MKNNIIPIVYYRTNFMNTYFLLTKNIIRGCRLMFSY